MASNLGELVATATLDIAPFQTNTKQLKTYLRGVDSSLKAVEKSVSSQGNKINGLRAVYNETGQALKGYQALLVKQTEKYNTLKSNIGDVASATEKEKNQLLGARTAMMDTAAKVAELQNKYNSLGREIATQSSVFTKLGSGFTTFGNGLTTVGDKIQNFGSTVGGVGKALTIGVTTPIVAGASAVVKSAISWESAFAGVKKTNDEVVDSNGNVVYSYADLESGLRGLAMQLPSTHEEIAGVAEAAGQLGIKTQDVVSFTKTMIDMGESTNLSAEDAATAIAKIANITGLTSDEYQRFGSSVVALGNNFATTESDIVSMANRLAASGTLAGLTNQEILGLATAMSSVGIEAEAGGTAMTQTLSAIESAVAAGGEDLQKFAIVAGESSEEFASKWKNKPIEAIQDFIRGLGQLDEKGSSATLVLDDMGLSGVRQSNMLKSLALAADTMTSAVDMSNQAWNENTALTNEANKRYETTESKLKMLKNQVKDTAIEFGGPLVDALSDALEAGKPFLETLSELAKKFSSLDKEQQQQIIKWGLIAAAAGPALSIVGKGVGIIGSVVSAFGTFNKGIGTVLTSLGKFSGFITTLGTSSASVEALATSAGTATASVGGLTGAVGLLGNPITWGVLLGGAALLAVGYFANKAAEAKQRTEEWGASVSETQANELQQFKDKVDETNQAMTIFGTNGAADVEAVRKAIQGLADDITTLADKDLNKKIKLAEKLGLSEEQIQRLKDAAQETKDNVNAMSNEVIQIYQNAANNHRDITETERAVVKSAQNAMIEEKLALLGYEKDESVAIRKAMNGEIDELNTTQAAKGLETVKKWIEEENTSYKKAKADYKEMYESKALTQAEYNQKIQELEANHNAVMEAYGEQYIELQKKVVETALKNSTPEAQKAILSQIQSTMEELGLSYEQFQAKMEETASAASKTSSLVGTYWADMSEEARTAVTYWNSIVLDPVTGDVKTNAQEEIQKALQAEGGWESMKLSVKEGRLTTTATMAIGEALIATGQWDSLSPEDKQLVIDKSPAMQAITESESSLQAWKEIPDVTKNLLANNTDFLNNADVAKTVLDNWNALTPDEKELVAKNLTSEDVTLAQNTIDQLSGKTVELNANDNTSQPTLDAYVKVNGVAQKAPAQVDAVDDTASATSSAQSKIDNTQQKSPASLKAQNDTGDGTSKAQNSIDNTRQRSPIGIYASDNVTSAVTGWVAALPTKHVINIVANVAGKVAKVLGFAKGTDFHPGGLAMVNDQKGPTYRELVTLPNGTSFIPQGRNVILPLPRGSKVLPAGKTKQLFPRYANGIGFENTRVADVARRIGNLQSQSDVVVAQSDNSNISQALNKLIELVAENTDSLDKLAARQIIIENYMDTERVGRSVAKSVTSEQERQESIKNAIYGMGW